MDTRAMDRACHKMADALDELDKAVPGREVSLAKTKIEEGLHWAQAAIRKAAPSINESSESQEGGK